MGILTLQVLSLRSVPLLFFLALAATPVVLAWCADAWSSWLRFPWPLRFCFPPSLHHPLSFFHSPLLLTDSCSKAFATVVRAMFSEAVGELRELGRLMQLQVRNDFFHSFVFLVASSTLHVAGASLDVTY